jgi:hypothetical protein
MPDRPFEFLNDQSAKIDSELATRNQNTTIVQKANER